MRLDMVLELGLLNAPISHTKVVNRTIAVYSFNEFFDGRFKGRIRKVKFWYDKISGKV